MPETKQSPDAANAGAENLDQPAKPITNENRTPAYKNQAAWRERNPKACWAHSALKSAVRRGIIEKQPCAVCGDPNSEAHHPDYNRPADVVWLCRRHHKAEHARLRRCADETV